MQCRKWGIKQPNRKKKIEGGFNQSQDNIMEEERLLQVSAVEEAIFTGNSHLSVRNPGICHKLNAYYCHYIKYSIKKYIEHASVICNFLTNK